MSAIDEVFIEGLEINMGIWNRVDTSDPMQLKQVNIGRKFLSIDAYPQIKKATELFGPMGIGFGIIDHSYDIIQDVDISTKNKPNTRGHVMVFNATFWFKYPGTDKNGQFPIMNSQVFTGHSDTPKKLMTNSISKALSYLGFNYDVFSGRWDDDPYEDRPDIPAPSYLKANLNTLLDTDFFTEDQRSNVRTFQINAGWTMNSVENSLGECMKRMEKKGYQIPTLLKEGDSSNGVSQANTVSEAEKKGSATEEKA